MTGRQGCTISLHMGLKAAHAQSRVSPGTLPVRSKGKAAQKGLQDCTFGKHGHCSHPSAVECTGPSKTRRRSRSPAPPLCSTRVTAAAGLPGGCIQLHAPRHPALRSARGEVCQGEGSWQKPVNPSAQASRDPAGPLPALMVGQIKSSALQVAHKKRLKQHSQ